MDSKPTSSDPIVPLISGVTAGPLGIMHLPRLWLKLLLGADARLPDGYRCGVGGSDENLCERFGLDRDALVAFVQTRRPTYLELEAYVREHARDLSPETIAAFNDFLVSFDMPDPRGSDWRARFDLDPTFTKAVLLNQLDDWAGAYEQVEALPAPVVPLISSGAAGPLGVKHLPRLWWKKLLDAHGKLYEGYRCGVGGFDERCSDALGLDRDAFAAWVKATKPDYLATEAWIRANAPAEKLTPASIAAFNEWVSTFDMPEHLRLERQARFHLDPAYSKGIALNDLDDWASVHAQITGAAAPA